MFLNRILAGNKWLFYAILCVVYILFSWASNHFLYSDSLYYNSLGEQYETAQIQKFLAWIKPWKLAGYFLIPVFIIIRILFTSFCMTIGNLVQETQWGFKSLFNISLKADIAYALNLIANFYYYAFSGNYQKIDDLMINHFSLLNYTGRENIPDWLTPAFNSVNLFEGIYILLLVLFIRNCFRVSLLKSFIFVLLTYCVGNYIYITTLTFISLNFNG